MKILFVHDRCGEFSGAEANLRLSARELARRGHWIGLAHGHQPAHEPASWQELFAATWPLAANTPPARLQALLAHSQPDLVYLHRAPLPVLATLLDSPYPVVRMVHDHELYCLRGSKYHLFGRRVCTRACSPYCVVPCGAVLGRHRQRRYWPLRWQSYPEKLREIALNRRCQAFVVYSAYARTEMVRNRFDPDRILVHAPVAPAPAASATASFSDRNLVLFAGLLVRGKGVDVLLDVLAQLRCRHECLVLGDGPHRASCQRRCRWLGLEQRVRFLGRVAPDALADYYRQGSVAVMSSVWPEPFGMAGPEAMRWGLPVVAFAVGGIPEWLQDGQNGFAVPWMDRALFALRLEQLLTDKALARRLGRQARLSVARFDVEPQVTRLEDLFRKLVAGQRETLCA